MWPTILHLLSPKQHSTMCHAKRKPLAKAGSPNILVATCNVFQGIFGFLCRCVLGCLRDVHARVDAFAA